MKLLVQFDEMRTRIEENATSDDIATAGIMRNLTDYIRWGVNEHWQVD